ncbi:hypothetical protein [Petropleomorpha daqingensis]|uniref:Uncharacterized protein n=1 Tax=Petropleomorpha daqingensis TaxID=2026353 RepID=A0A853CJ63_9ACTN|nr:hypothetical protein [Petropleomorpha daqingensis]NYJ08064.1 hypothetical protein [Petropleomorpha daqingensis]
MLEFLTVVGLVVLLIVTVLVTTVWMALRRIRRSRLVATARTAIAVGTPLLAAHRPSAVRNPAAALRVVRLTRAQWALRRAVTDATRTGAYLGDVPAVLPRLQAETDRIRTGLSRLPDAATPAARELLAAADRHLATLSDLTDAVAATQALPAAEGTLSHEAADAAHGLRLYAAAYAELLGGPTAPAAQRRAG